MAARQEQAASSAETNAEKEQAAKKGQATMSVEWEQAAKRKQAAMGERIGAADEQATPTVVGRGCGALVPPGRLGPFPWGPCVRAGCPPLPATL